MPQLPAAAAAAFIIGLLAVLAAILVVVRIRSRRRQTRLALMVRATAPIPRPTVSAIEPPPDPAPASRRGRSYQPAEQGGQFVPFEERTGREPPPGRPARRLAAQVAHAAPAEPPPAPAAVLPVTPAPPVEFPPAPAAAIPVTPALPVEFPPAPPAAHPVTTVPLAEFLSAPAAALPAPAAAFPVTPASPVELSLTPAAISPSHETLGETGLTAASPEGAGAEPSVAATEMFIPAPAAPDLDTARAPGASPKPVASPGPPVPNLTSPLIEEMSTTEAPEPQSAPHASASAPRRAPEITVLAPRAALPALMAREVTLGDAARLLRGAVPDALTMTDGRQVRRAVAIGAATSVIAAALAIRSRRR